MTFSGATGTTNTVNQNYSLNQLLWTGTSAWILNSSSGAVISLFDFGGAQAKVENQSTGLVTINAPITFAANNGAPPNPFGEINAVNGDITFGSGTLTVNGASVNGIKMFSGGHTVTCNNTVSASGKWFGLTAVGSGMAVGGSFTSGDIYVMNSGTLSLNSGGSISTSAIRLGGDFGNTTNQNQTLGGTFLLTSSTGGQNFSGIINSVSGNTSNALLVNSLNTSGTNTLSGGMFLDSPLTLQNSAGGTLTLSGSSDFKAQTLTFNPSGTMIVTGTLQSSLAAGGSLVKTGTGTLILNTNNNTYSGTNSGSLSANSTVISGGVLGIVGDLSLGVAPAGAYNNIQFTASGTLQDFQNNITLASTRNILINSGTATFDTLGNTLTIGGVISGSGGLTKIGSGTLTLSGTNTYSGATTLSAGTVVLSNTTSALGASGSVLNINGGVTLAESAGLTLTNTTVNITSDFVVGNSTANSRLTLSATSTMDFGGATRTITLYKGNAVTNSGNAQLQFGGSSTYQNGTLRLLGGAGASVTAPAIAILNTATAFNSDLIIGANATTNFGTGTLSIKNVTVEANGGLNLSDGGANSRNLTVTSLSGAGSVNNSATSSGTATLTVNTAGNTTFSGLIQDGGYNATTLGKIAITKSGAGTQTLSGSNSYSGGTTITGGTLGIGNNFALGTGALTSTTGAGTLTFATGAPYSLANNIVLGNNLTILGTNNLTLTGTISNTTTGRTLTYNGLGAGILTLTASNTYGGTLAANGGTLNLDYSAASAPTSNILASTGTVSLGGATLNMIGKTGTTNSQTFAATIFNAGPNVIAATSASGTANLSLGTIARNAGGTLNILPATSGTIGSPTGTASSTIGYWATVSGTTWAVKDSGNTQVVGAAQSFYTNNPTGSSVTWGTIPIDVNTAGQTRSTANWFLPSMRFNSSAQDWFVDVKAGTLGAVNGVLVTPNVGAHTVTFGALRAQSSGVEFDIQQYNTSSTLIFNGLGNNTGASAYVQAGPGTVIMNTGNGYTGQTYLNGGVTEIFTNDGLGLASTNANLNLNGGTLVSATTASLDNGTQFRPVVLGSNGGGLAAVSGNTLTVTGVVSGSGLLKIGTGLIAGTIGTGNGMVALTAPNTNSGGTLVNTGTLQINGINALGGGNYGGLTFNGGSLRYVAGFSGNGSGDISIPGAGVASGTGAVTIASGTSTIDTNGNAVTYTQSIGNGGAGALIKSGSGTLTLSASNSYSGGTIVNSGTLLANNAAGTATGSGAVAINNGGVFVANNSGGSASSGAVSINNGGVFLANNSAGTASSGGVTINSGGKLGGSGIITSLVTTGSGGLLAPGNSVGTITLGSLTLSGSSILNYEFNGSANDLTIVTGSNALTINGGGFNLYNENLLTAFSTSGTYNLIAYTGTVGGSGIGAFSVLNQLPGKSYTFGTITLSGTNFVNLTILATANVATWNINSGGSWATQATGTTNWDSGTVPNSQGDVANFGSIITAPVTVTLDGDKAVGTLTFTNTNGYTIASGTGGTLHISSTATGLITDASGSHAIGVPVSLDSNTTISVTNGADTLAMSSAVSGTGAIAKGGAGTLSLSASNSYSGGTTLNSGTLQVGDSSALGSETLAFAGNSTLRSGSAGIAPANNVSIGNALTATVDTQANTFNLGGAISDTSSNGALTKIGSGTLILTGSNTYAGATTISSGTLQVGDGTVGSLATTGTVTVAASSALAVNLANGGTFGNAVTNNGAVKTISSGSNTILGIVSGTGTLAQSGAGTTTLSAANTFTGNTVISGGVLRLNNTLALQNSTLNYNNQGGSLSFGTLTAATIAALTGAQDLALTNASAGAVALTLGAAGQTMTYTGNLSGNGSLIKSGTGTLTIGSGSSGGASYTGATTHSSGTLVLGGTASANAGSNNFTIANNGGSGSVVFADSASYTTTGVMTVATGNTFPGASNVQVKNNSNVTVGSFRFGDNNARIPTNTFFTIQDSAFFTANGTFDLNNTSSGTTVASNDNLNLNGGTLTVTRFLASNGNTGTGPHLSTIHFNGGLLASNTDSAIFLPALTGLTANVDSGGARINDNGYAITIAANLLHGTGTPDGGLTKSGSGTLTLSGTNNTYNGATAINAGTLQVSTNGALGATSGTTTVTSSAALKFNNVNYTTAEPVTINGSGISGGGALTNTGTSSFAGAVTLGNNSSISAGGSGQSLTLTGGISKDGKTLTIGGGGTVTVSGLGITGASANSDLVVDASTLLLSASSTYNGPTTVQNSGVLQLGANEVMPISPASPLTLNTSGIFDLASYNGTVASLADDNSGTVKNSTPSTTGTLTLSGNGSTSFGGLISGTAGGIGDVALGKTGNGTLTLSGSNTYSGGTTLTSGTLVAGHDSALGTGLMTLNGGNLASDNDFRSIPNAITVTGTMGNQVTGNSLTFTGNAGGSGRMEVALSGSSKTLTVNPSSTNGFAPNEIKVSQGTLLLGNNNVVGDSTKIDLAGGTFNTGGKDEIVGALTLSANSTIDFNNNGTLRFTSDSTSTSGLLLTISNWTGGFGGGTGNHLVFTNTPTSTLLGEIQFAGFGPGANAIAFSDGNGSGFELVPVPEPATIIGAFAFVGLIVLRERRRFRSLLRVIRQA